MTSITPCGDDTIYCIDCIGNGVCPFTKEDDRILTDEEKTINDHMIKALKDSLGIDIVAIKNMFNE